MSNPIYYIVRHGLVESNQTGRHIGQREEPLLPKGERQAKNLSDLLSDQPLTHVYTSPLARSRTTAEIIAGARVPRLYPEVDPRLTELNMGAWDGMLPGEASGHYPEEYAGNEINTITKYPNARAMPC
jgi:broad specificity phosphatase PhoE